MVIFFYCALSWAEPTQEGIAPVALAVSTNGNHIYIAESSPHQIAILNRVVNKIIDTITLPEQPSGLVISPSGDKLFVTAGSSNGFVFVIDTHSNKIVAQWRTGHTPEAPTITPNGKTLFVCNRFNNDISVLNATTGVETARVPVEREPVTAAITPDGKTLFIGNLLPAGSSIGDYTGSVVSVMDVLSNKVTNIQLVNGSTSVKGICISPDGHYVFVVHILAHYQLPTMQVEGGWMNCSALSVIDVTRKKLVNTIVLDDPKLGAADPSSVACSADGQLLCVTHAGTHEVSIIDRQSLHDRLNHMGESNIISATAEKFPNDFSVISGIRRRIQLAGNGPRSMVLIGNKAYIGNYFSDDLEMIDINSENIIAPVSIPLEINKKTMSIERHGEMLFNDATLCRQHWQSCASCHPGNARTDALNWDLLNDGLGNPKNTKSLLLVHKTPPAMWLGVRESAELGVRSGFRFIEFAVRPEADSVAVDTYLKSLKPVPSPHLVNGLLSPAAERGKKVFEEAECNRCHTPPLFSSQTLHNLHMGTGIDQDKPFAVPTLIEVWRTAPYLHDGRAATIREVLTKFNPSDCHASTSDLTDQELDNLIEYVISL